MVINSLLIVEKHKLPTDSGEWLRLCAFTKDVASSGLVELPILQTSLELNLLQGAGLCASEQNEKKKMTKINTNFFYRQQKYNLLREESEGYAKLVVILSSLSPIRAEADDQVSHVLSLGKILIYSLREFPARA